MKMSDTFKLPISILERGDQDYFLQDEDDVDDGGDFGVTYSESTSSAIEHAINNHDELVEALESMLDAHGEGNCRYVRGCCQEHFDLTGDGSCYIGEAKQVLKNAKGES